MPLNLAAVSALGVGGIVVYAGLTGKSLTPIYQNGKMVSPGIIRSLFQGNNPAGVAQTMGITGAAGESTDGSASAIINGGDNEGLDIASDAMQYEGHAYEYGGTPGTDGQNPWDCSSFVNWVLGHDFGFPIPGVTHYDGSSHGPSTLSYLVWSGAATIKRSQAQAGDLAVCATHMGIFVSNTQYISAHDPAEGTTVTAAGLQIIPGEVLVCRRINGVNVATSAAPVKSILRMTDQ